MDQSNRVVGMSAHADSNESVTLTLPGMGVARVCVLGYRLKNGVSTNFTLSYATAIPGVFLCSSSTPPGVGVHGISAAAIVALMFRLNTERRAKEVGLLLAVGARRAAYLALRAELFKLKDSGRIQDVADLLDTRLAVAFGAYTGALQKLLAYQTQEARTMAALSASQYQSSRALLIGLGLATLALGAASSACQEEQSNTAAASGDDIDQAVAEASGRTTTTGAIRGVVVDTGGSVLATFAIQSPCSAAIRPMLMAACTFATRFLPSGSMSDSSCWSASLAFDRYLANRSSRNVEPSSTRITS